MSSDGDYVDEWLSTNRYLIVTSERDEHAPRFFWRSKSRRGKANVEYLVRMHCDSSAIALYNELAHVAFGSKAL
jgi:hypothetical protein